ncbi:hypothetical protein LUZ60_015568 [Juncus effusus]|nr:hypothetical protein LUZ60_015568 [Juncus effusus]
MGNYLSCTLANSAMASPSIKVILPDGTIHRVNEPTTAAELMLDYSGHFITEAKSMQIGKRLLALSADDELEIATVYVVLPMKRLNAVCAASDMARLMVLANKEAKRGSVARVRPDSANDHAKIAEERVKIDEVQDVKVAAEIGEFKHRLSVGRSRRPSLETIQEEIFPSRYLI